MDAVASGLETSSKRRKVRNVRKAPPKQTELVLDTTDTAEGAVAPNVTRIPLRSDPVIGWFFVCLAVGLGITVLALFENVILKRIGLIGPFAATAAYPAIGLALGIATRPAARERFADNCYYLGFIFTQAALFFAFLPATFMGRALQSTDVLGFFGMALSAALTGLMARTILVQLGGNLPEAEDAVHKEVQEVARQVAERSRTIVSEFQSMAKAAGSVTSTMSARLDELTNTLSRFDEVVRQELSKFEIGARDVEVAMLDAEGGAREHQQAFGDHISQAAEALKSLQANLSAQASEALVSLKSATTAIQSGSEALGEISGLRPSVGALQAQLKKLENVGSDIEKLSDDISANIERSAADATEKLTASVGDAGVAIAKTAKESAARLSSTTAEAGTILQSNAEAFEQDLSTTTKRLATALSGFREELARLNEQRGSVSDAT